MSVILSIETSTPICSISLHQNEELISKLSLNKGMSHSSLLSPSIDSLLKLSGISQSDLSAIALSKGPGSYTGLRIGTSTAKGLCYALDIPLISVETLRGMAAGMINPEGHFLCPMLDARRMEVYTSMFDRSLNTLEPTRPVILDENSFAEILKKGKVIFFGDGSSKFKDVISNKNAIFINGVVPKAENIGALAIQKYNTQEFEDLAYFEPFYLKEFRATKPKSML